MAKAVIDGVAIEFTPPVLLSDLLPHIDKPCGGAGTCGRCRVRATGALSAPDEAERRFALPGGTRLACRTQAEGDVAVTTPPSEMAVLGGAPHGVGYADAVTAVCGDDAVVGDAHGGVRSLRDSGGGTAAAGESQTARGAPRARLCAAIDVGTTTVVASLYADSDDGRVCLGSVSAKNPQTTVGADVVTRIRRALDGEAATLASLLQQCLAALLNTLAQSASTSPSPVTCGVAAGNTAMLHLLTGEDSEPLSHAPFAARRLFGETVQIGGLPSLYLPRCMGAFVGADTTAAVLASGMTDRNETSVLMDIGTNGELALWHNGKLHVCSTAAGPAFEGSGLACGVYGITGAVDHVRVVDGVMSYTTIGDATPVGICGSGIVDAVAAALKLGIIDETGAFEDGDRFDVAPGVFVTAQDVRSIQLAKGSIRAGLETLLDTAGVAHSDVAALYIAGGFGNFLDAQSAADIGLIPPDLLHIARPIGNAALEGAVMMLDDGAVEKAESIARRANIVALDANPVFTDYFMEHMMFNELFEFGQK